MSRTPTSPAAERTHERILDGALELFNRDGTTAVTTNHIAAHLGISPGNLYYWFAGKPEIIRALFTRFASSYAALWAGTSADDDGRPSDPQELLSRLSSATELTRAYQFLARDLLALVHEDAVLRAEYVATRELRVADFLDLARDWRSTGVIRPVTDERLDDVVRALWIVAETWWPFAELNAERPRPGDGERLLRAVLEPYLSGPDEEGTR
jgi:AcrR family transcriptional regulator